MNSTVADTAGSPHASAAPAAKPTVVVLLALIRREFWEHRYLWIAPLAVEAILIALGAIIGHGQVQLDGHDFGAWASQHAQKVAAFTILQWAQSVPLVVVLIGVVSWYALDCLYAERKDRSVLFWKSLPVSDGLTVLSKALVALVAAPLVTFAVALAGYLVFAAVLGVRMALGGIPSVIAWDFAEWFRTEAAMLIMLVVAMLWYAPVVAAMLLLSVWARPNPFLWAFLAPVVAPLIERIAFGTHYLAGFMKYRAFDIWGTLAYGPTHGHFGIVSGHDLRPMGTLLDQFNIGAVLTDIDLWLGVAAAAALLYAAARVRRYREEG